MAKVSVGSPRRRNAAWQTGADLQAAVRAMKASAVAVFVKPADAEALLCAVDEAIEQSRAATEALSTLMTLRVDHAALSGRRARSCR